MRVVVDTNVLISAVLKDASTPAIAMRIVERQGRLLKSSATESELSELLTRPYFARLINPRARLADTPAGKGGADRHHGGGYGMPRSRR